LTTKQIHLNAFEMNCVGHLARGMWRHPADTRYRYTDLEYWNAEAAAVYRRTSAPAIR
jgi:hypothetical protein